MIETWEEGIDVSSFEIYLQNQEALKNSLEFISEHTRGEQLRGIFKALSSAVKPSNTSTQYIDLNVVKKMSLSEIPYWGFEEIFTHMSDDYRDAQIQGAIRGNHDAITLLQTNAVPILSQTREAVENNVAVKEIKADGTTSHLLSTKIPGVNFEFRYPAKSDVSELFLVVNPLEKNPISSEQA